MTSAPRILPAGPADLAEIGALAREIWEEHYTPIIGAAQVAYMLARRADPHQMADELAAGVRYEALRDGAGMLRGYASHARADGALARADDWKLRQLYLAAAVRGQGLGAALLAVVRAAAVQAGAGHLILAVNRRNARALAAYRRWGFGLRGDVRVDIGGGFVMDDHILELALR